MGRTVVLHPGALGDVLLSIPALRALRARAPDDELVLAAQPRIGRLLASLAIVDRPLAFDMLGLETLFTDDAPPERLRELVAGARVVSWFGRGDAGFTRRLRALAGETVVASTVPSDGGTVWEHLVASVGTRAPVAAIAQAWRAAIVVPRGMVADGRHALARAGWNGTRPLVLLQPGAGGATKRWAVDGFAEAAAAVVDELGADLVVHDGPADHDAVAALRARLRVPASVLADPPLEALAGAMRHAALWIGNDSGVTHLAAAVGTPTLALFIAAHVAWRPWARHARVRVVGVDALSRLDVDAVIAEAANLLRPRAARAVGDRGAG
jgi:ADP-heptose:LPS heptosyltransferase